LASVRLYTLREVAAQMRVSLSTVRYWVHTHRLGSVRPARHRLVPAHELAAFIEQRRRESRS
jgi:excisionase family DNA binding protein